MKTLKFVENDDGSATVTLEISEEENNTLIQYAITNILKEEIEKEEPSIKKLIEEREKEYYNVKKRK